MVEPTHITKHAVKVVVIGIPPKQSRLDANKNTTPTSPYASK